MSIPVQNSGDNRSTTGVVVAMLLSEKIFEILPNLQIISLLYLNRGRFSPPVSDVNPCAK